MVPLFHAMNPKLLQNGLEWSQNQFDACQFWETPVSTRLDYAGDTRTLLISCEGDTIIVNLLQTLHAVNPWFIINQQRAGYEYINHID